MGWLNRGERLLAAWSKAEADVHAIGEVLSQSTHAECVGLAKSVQDGFAAATVREAARLVDRECKARRAFRRYQWQWELWRAHKVWVFGALCGVLGFLLGRLL